MNINTTNLILNKMYCCGLDLLRLWTLCLHPSEGSQASTTSDRRSVDLKVTGPTLMTRTSPVNFTQPLGSASLLSWFSNFFSASFRSSKWSIGASGHVCLSFSVALQWTSDPTRVSPCLHPRTAERGSNRLQRIPETPDSPETQSAGGSSKL